MFKNNLYFYTFLLGLALIGLYIYLQIGQLPADYRTSKFLHHKNMISLVLVIVGSSAVLLGAVLWYLKTYRMFSEIIKVNRELNLLRERQNKELEFQSIQQKFSKTN